MSGRHYAEWIDFVDCEVGSFMDATAQSPEEKEWVRINETVRRDMEALADQELAEQIAVGMHTGLRKGSDADSATTLWRAISDSSDSAWTDAAAFCVYGLKSMGYTVTRQVTP